MRFNKHTLMGGLLAIVFLLAVVYSTYATQLRINGVANVAANWDIHIKSITPGTPVGTASVKEAPMVGIDRLSASFSTNLLKPGDALTYTIVVENGGNLDASLNDIIFSKDASDYIDFTYSGISVGDRLNAGKTKSFTITALYKEVATQINADLTSNVYMVLTYVQRH